MRRSLTLTRQRDKRPLGSVLSADTELVGQFQLDGPTLRAEPLSPCPARKEGTMRKGFGLFLSAASALLLSVLPMPAAAAQSITGTGSTHVVSQTVISSRTADGNVIFEFEFIVGFDGLRVGSEVVDFTLVRHQSGLEEFFGTGTFTGTVSGVGTGTLEEVLSGNGPAPNTFSGKFIITSGTGDLAGLHGTLAFQVPPATYSAMYVLV